MAGRLRVGGTVWVGGVSGACENRLVFEYVPPVRELERRERYGFRGIGS